MIISTFNSKKEALIKMPMPIPVIESFIYSPVYFDSAASEEAGGGLNVNGQRFRRNPDKSIWSYNPEDTSLNVCILDMNLDLLVPLLSFWLK